MAGVFNTSATLNLNAVVTTDVNLKQQSAQMLQLAKNHGEATSPVPPGGAGVPYSAVYDVVELYSAGWNIPAIVAITFNSASMPNLLNVLYNPANYGGASGSALLSAYASFFVSALPLSYAKANPTTVLGDLLAIKLSYQWDYASGKAVSIPNNQTIDLFSVPVPAPDNVNSPLAYLFSLLELNSGKSAGNGMLAQELFSISATGWASDFGATKADLTPVPGQVYYTMSVVTDTTANQAILALLDGLTVPVTMTQAASSVTNITLPSGLGSNTIVKGMTVTIGTVAQNVTVQSYSGSAVTLSSAISYSAGATLKFIPTAQILINAYMRAAPAVATAAAGVFPNGWSAATTIATYFPISTTGVTTVFSSLISESTVVQNVAPSLYAGRAGVTTSQTTLSNGVVVSGSTANQLSLSAILGASSAAGPTLTNTLANTFPLNSILIGNGAPAGSSSYYAAILYANLAGVPLSSVLTTWSGSLGLIEYLQSIGVTFTQQIMTDINTIYQQQMRRLTFRQRAQLFYTTTTQVTSTGPVKQSSISTNIVSQLFHSSDDFYDAALFISTAYNTPLTAGAVPSAIFATFLPAPASTLLNGFVNPLSTNAVVGGVNVLNLLGAIIYLETLTPSWAFETIPGTPSWQYTTNSVNNPNAIFTQIPPEAFAASATAPSTLFTQYYAWGLATISVNGFQTQTTIAALTSTFILYNNVPSVYSHLPASGNTAASTVNLQKNQALGLQIAGSINSLNYLMLQLPSPVASPTQVNAQAILNLQQLLLSVQSLSGTDLQAAFENIMGLQNGTWNQISAAGVVTDGIQSSAPQSLSPTQIFLYAISQDPLIASSYANSNTSLNVVAANVVSTPAAVVQTYVSLLPNFVIWINKDGGKRAVLTVTSTGSVNTIAATAFAQLLAFGYGLSTTANAKSASLTPAQMYSLFGTTPQQQQAFFAAVLGNVGSIFPSPQNSQPLFTGSGSVSTTSLNAYSPLYPIMQQVGAAFFANQRTPTAFLVGGTLLQNWALAFADHTDSKNGVSANYQQLASVGFTTAHLLTYLRTFLRFNHGLQQMTSVVTLAFDVLSTEYLNAFTITADEVTKIALIEGIILDAV